ncbi:MAG: hypothetical protein E7400_06750 [Ruminococcaceae bacterium]|nr:hypothetical protein [Oscillospiraceae bacterium]
MTEALLGAVVPGIVVGIVLAYWNRKQNKKDNQRKSVEEAAVESDMLRIDLEVATAQLSYAVAMAVKRGHANGEMEVAIERYEKAMEKFRRFERKQIAINGNEA